MLESGSAEGGTISTGKVHTQAHVMAFELWRLMASTRYGIEGLVRMSSSRLAEGRDLKSCCQHHRITSKYRMGLFNSYRP